MSLTTRISSRYTRIVSAQCRNSSVISTRRHPLSVPSSYFHSLGEPHSKVVASQVSLFHNSFPNVYAFQRFAFSSVPSPENPEKENSANGGSTVENNGATAKASGDAKAPEQGEGSISEDSDEELSMEDLVKLLTEKEELLKVKHKEIEKMQDKVLHTYTYLNNLMDRARRDMKNSKEFALQNFAQCVADNLGRASSVVKESFSKIDTSKDTAGAVPLLKTLLEDVEMTEKDLMEVVGGRASLFHRLSLNASASKAPEQREEPISEDSEKKFIIKDMLKLVIEREKLQMAKLKEIEKMQKEVNCKNEALRNVLSYASSGIREIIEIRESVPRRPICYCCESRIKSKQFKIALKKKKI